MSPLTMEMCDSVINFLRGKMIYNVGIFFAYNFCGYTEKLDKGEIYDRVRGHSMIEIYDNFPINCLYNNLSRILIMKTF
jgi:hypothetical protein